MPKTIIRKIASPLSVRNRALDYASRPTPNEDDPKRKGAVIGSLAEAVTKYMLHQEKPESKPEKELVESYCRLIIAWLFLDVWETFEPMSRADLTPQMINGLSHWMSEYQGEYPNGEWVERPTFSDELTWILYWAGIANKWTQEAILKDEEFAMADVLKRYQQEATIPDGEPGYWDKQIFSGIEIEISPLPEPDGISRLADQVELITDPFAGLE